MNYVYLKPELENLSQGERISFARQMRRMTQDEVSEKLGLTGECKRRSMTRYERGDRIPKEDRLLEIAKILNVNVNAIKSYDYINPNDLIYINIWMEELIPGYKIDLDTLDKTWFDSVKYLKLFVRDWKEMNQKLENKEISLKEYIEWKLNTDVTDLEKNKTINKTNISIEQER